MTKTTLSSVRWCKLLVPKGTNMNHYLLPFEGASLSFGILPMFNWPILEIFVRKKVRFLLVVKLASVPNKPIFVKFSIFNSSYPHFHLLSQTLANFVVCGLIGHFGILKTLINISFYQEYFSSLFVAAPCYLLVWSKVLFGESMVSLIFCASDFLGGQPPNVIHTFRSEWKPCLKRQSLFSEK